MKKSMSTWDSGIFARGHCMELRCFRAKYSKREASSLGIIMIVIVKTDIPTRSDLILSYLFRLPLFLTRFGSLKRKLKAHGFRERRRRLRDGVMRSYLIR